MRRTDVKTRRRKIQLRFMFDGYPVQLRLDATYIGRYAAVKGGEKCPEGSLQIWEGDQPLLPPSRMAGGAWCGGSDHPRFFYTESNAVTFVIRLPNTR